MIKIFLKIFSIFRKSRQSVETLDVTKTKSILTQIRRQNESLADHLAELLNRYRFDMLQKLLQP